MAEMTLLRVAVDAKQTTVLSVGELLSANWEQSGEAPMEARLSRALRLSIPILSLMVCVACDSGSDPDNSGDADNNGDPGNGPVYTQTTCTSAADDSTQNQDGSASPIVSHENGSVTYHIVGTRRTVADVVVNMEYMVHEPAGTPEALLVLIAGGSLKAGIEGDQDGGTVSASGSNFLVRSAHLFAAQGYRVVTIERPTDFGDWTTGSSNYEYDGYRVSVNHAVDLARVINRVKDGDNLPVVICGTSRGAISAVNQYFLADAIAISAPVTSGNGVPVGSAGGVSLADVDKPVHVLWHEDDACSNTQPAKSAALLNDFSYVEGAELDGGFADTVVNEPCQALDYHGFLGIESCAVTTTTAWVASLAFDATRPATTTENSRVAEPIDPDETVDIDLSDNVTAAAGGALTYSLPYTTTSLGGTVSISGSTVTYTPAHGVAGTRDTFVYVVSEEGGGTAHNRVAVAINPDP